ncbi:hypothetical protein [Longispora fulva]|uniref:SprT-like family protein n=1 Tax=Longispora fulva TaxID=619741 RepID=A0A8J7KJC6_9ACTN|nr:hypothetical protein [Longispora fulva]MBG6140250.1 hypothetical protein [Longispora fulva]
MNSTGSTIIKALECAWEAIQEAHPEVPSVVFITGTGASGRGLKWGHHWADRWTNKDSVSGERATELFISGERLACGGTLTFQTMLHEAAHALARVRGQQDTSRQGRYHNKTFLKLAEELGLSYNHEAPDATIGLSAVEIREETTRDFAGVIAMLDDEIIAHLGTVTFIDGGAPIVVPTPRGGTTTTTTTRKAPAPKAECGCETPRKVSAKLLEDGAIMCRVCGEDFEVRD